MTTYLNGTGLMVNWPIEKKPINLFYSKKKKGKENSRAPFVWEFHQEFYTG